MPDLFAATENSFKAKLQSISQRLAASNVFIGTSSWKYPGWCGQIYDEQRYCYRGKFAETRFQRDCLAEYAEVFKTVCVDAAYYQFPSMKYLDGLMTKVPGDFLFTFLSRLFGRSSRRGSLGVPSDWQTIGTMTPSFGSIFIGDASIFPDDLQAFPASAQSYTVQVRRLDFAGDVRVSALRLVTTDSITVGESVGTVSSDCAALCATSLPCSLDQFREALQLQPLSDRDMEYHCDEDAGVATLSTEPPAEVFYCASGFGDGSFAVHRLLSGGTAAGYQVTFIRDDEPYSL